MADASPTPALRLTVRRGDEILHDAEFTEPSITIGRGEQALLIVDDDSVGELHAIVNVEDDGAVRLLDVGVESGILLQGERVYNAELQSGDLFQVGDISVEITLLEPTVPVAAEALAAAAAHDASEPIPAPEAEEDDPATEEASMVEPERTSPAVTTDVAGDPIPAQSTEDIMEWIMRSGTAKHDAGIDRKAPKVLEVNQIWLETLLDTKHFAKSGPSVTIGTSVGFKWNLLGIDVGWVPANTANLLTVTPPIWSDVRSEWRNDFYTPNDSLPAQVDYNLFVWDGSEYTARVDSHWGGFVDIGDKRYTFDDLVAAGKARKSGQVYEIPVDEQTRIAIEIDGIVYFAHQVHAGKRVVASATDDIDYPFLGIFSFFAFIGLMFGVIMYYAPPPADNELNEIPDRFVELLLEKPEPEKKESKKPEANPDAGEGAKAKKEEGKVGKKDAKMKKAKGNKKEIDKAKKDREIAENAGVLGALNELGMNDGNFASSGLDANLTGGIGGLIGAKGTQLGSGGLGSRGSGLGGGGSAEGLGGLGTKGMGSGSSGFGAGGGNFGAKGEGKLSATAGDPIILGALDRSLIDEVIKRKMSQIRYCYQRELQKDPTLAGKVVIKFTISKDGSVSSASTKSSTVGSPAVNSCVVGRFYKMQFPEPKGGGIVIVSYPFIFSPG